MSAPIKLPPCPDWCRDRDNPQHVEGDLCVEVGAGGEVQVTARHDGPEFGPFSGSGEIDIVTGEAWYRIDDDGLSVGLRAWSDSSDLVELGTQALRAAQWLADLATDEEPSRPAVGSGPHQNDVDALREVLDLMDTFQDNDQRARYLLSSNWLRDRGAAAAKRLRSQVAAVEEVRA